MGKYKILAVNTLLFAINAFATKFITFLLVPLYTYFMSPDEYGVTDMSLTAISLAFPLATLSIADACVRYVIQDKKNRATYVFLSFLISMASIIIVAAALPVLDLEVFGGLGEYKIHFLIAYATSAIYQYCSEVERGYGRIKIIPLCAGLSSIITLVSAIVFIGVLRENVYGYFISVSVGPAVGSAIFCTYGGLGKEVLVGFRSISKRNSGDKSPCGSYIKRMLKYSIPLIPNALFWWVGTSINRFFIVGMLGISASGMFAAAGKLPNLVNTVYSIFQQAWQLSAFQESDRDRIEEFFSIIFSGLQAVLLIFCSCLAIAAPLISRIFLQNEFYRAWQLMPILMLANLFNAFNAFYGTIYTTSLKTKYIMQTTIAGAIACIILNPILIQQYGTYGACIASALSNALVFVLRALNSQKILKFYVNWGRLTASVAILIAQTVLMIIDVNVARIAAVMLLLPILALQYGNGKRVLGIIRPRS